MAAALGAFLLLRLTAWPPHEDEALALFVGQGSLPHVLETVLGERGGAPLHFLLAWLVTGAGGGLGALRLLSALFALLSLPLIAALATRLADRAAALAATLIAAAGWVLLFHGIYARMYSLFLFTSLLSYLALLAALERGGSRRFLLWIAAALLTVAAHPYGVLVLGSQGLYVALVRERLRAALAAFAAVAILGTPFWLADLVLADRFEVGVGPGGEKLGRPVAVLQYLGEVAGDFSVGWPVALPLVLALAGGGLWSLARRNRRSALLVVAVIAVPTAALLFARLGGSTSPESRHLIFVLPFFVTLLAAGLFSVARLQKPFAPPLAAAVAVALVGGEVAWAWDKTPALFEGEPGARIEARRAAADWLAATGDPSDVLLGYEPVYLGAWERSERFSRLVLPRADAGLAAERLREVAAPLGRGLWILDAADTNNAVQRLRIPRRLPRPAAAFEARVFGPYLVVRSREPARTAAAYLEQAAAVAVLGKTLEIGDADVNFLTVSRAAALLDYAPSEAVPGRSSSSP